MKPQVSSLDKPVLRLLFISVEGGVRCSVGRSVLETRLEDVASRQNCTVKEIKVLFVLIDAVVDYFTALFSNVKVFSIYIYYCTHLTNWSRNAYF